MKRAVTLAILFFVTFASTAMAIEGLALRGSGSITYMGFIDVYDAALFTEDGDAATDIMDPELSKCLRLDYKLALSAKDFIQAADTVLKRQHPPQTLQRVNQEISALNKAYLPVKQGDRYQLCYDGKRKGTTLSLNRQKLITIDSADFASIYFGIWLGPREPIDERLRDSLLYGRK